MVNHGSAWQRRSATGGQAEALLLKQEALHRLQLRMSVGAGGRAGAQRGSCVLGQVGEPPQVCGHGKLDRRMRN